MLMHFDVHVHKEEHGRIRLQPLVTNN